MKPDQFRQDFVVPYSPEEDGTSHINIYSRGKELLGRRLSHFAQIPFDHPVEGHFASMEGYWYFIRNGRTDEELRHLAGMAAKRQGNNGKWVYNPHFRDEVLAANYLKIVQNPMIKDEFVASTLPFAHYYMFPSVETGDMAAKAAIGSDWLIDGFETIRREMKEGKVPSAFLRCQQRWNEEAAGQGTPKAMPIPQPNAPVPRKMPPPPMRDRPEGHRPPPPRRDDRPKQHHAPVPAPSNQTASLLKRPR